MLDETSGQMQFTEEFGELISNSVINWTEIALQVATNNTGITYVLCKPEISEWIEVIPNKDILVIGHYKFSPQSLYPSVLRVSSVVKLEYIQILSNCQWSLSGGKEWQK
jgi:hypothetical protein